ncbi:MAG: hypothetical protein H0W06_08235 [Chloroflexia bacterium]|nr:hypothetical protein [Chloroflexia bacterium]
MSTSNQNSLGDPAGQVTVSAHRLTTSMTRREGLRKAAYIAPAVVGLQIAVPNVALGRSGKKGGSKDPSKGEGKSKGKK